MVTQTALAKMRQTRKLLIIGGAIFWSCGSLAAKPLSLDITSSESRVVLAPYFLPHISAQKSSLGLDCRRSSTTLLDGVDAAMRAANIATSELDDKWLVSSFSTLGYNPKMPASAGDKTAARRVIALLRHDNLVAAKLASDQYALKVPSFATTDFFRDSKHYINNGLTPSDTLEGRSSNGIESALSKQMTLWLRDAVVQLAVVKSLLGPYYKDQAVRYYALGNVFDDGIAVEASQMALCAAEKDPLVRSSISKISSAHRTKRPTAQGLDAHTHVP